MMSIARGMCRFFMGIFSSGVGTDTLTSLEFAPKTMAKLVLALVCVLGATLLEGCATFESSAVTDIVIKNDTPHFVLVKDCRSSHCSSFRYTRSIGPGRSVLGHDYGDGTSWWRVANHEGRVIGCLSLGISARQEGTVLRVSRVRSCPYKRTS